MASTRRQDAKAATRAKVLAAATKLFADFGYERSTMRGIAYEAGMSTGAVVANFSDKAELYAAVKGHRPLSPEDGEVLLDVLSAIVRDAYPHRDGESLVNDRLIENARAAILATTPAAQTEAA